MYGRFLIVAFTAYLLSVAVAIARGVLAAPEASDCNSDSDSNEEANTETNTLSYPNGALCPARPLYRYILLLLLGLVLLTLLGYVLSVSILALID